MTLAASGGLLALLTLAVVAGAPWWVIGLLAPPTLLWAPGVPWSRRTTPDGSALDRSVDAAWLSMGAMWLTVSLCRELGLLGSTATVVYLAIPALLWVGGVVLGKGPSPRRLRTGPRIGVAAVFIGVALISLLRLDDLRRPLHDHWYLEGADQHEQHDKLPVVRGDGWGDRRTVGWDEAGAEIWTPTADRAELLAAEDLEGTLILAVQGGQGARISVEHAGRVYENTVAEHMQEEGAEFPEPRYLPRGGVAAVAIPLKLSAGQALTVDLDLPEDGLPARVFVMPSTEAIWALHATGVLRFTHRWQILNQVENQVWANEMQTTRRFTWNQPPGWSPLLTMQVQLTGRDLDAAALLFVWVLVMVGLSGVRAAAALVPAAPSLAWAVPGGLVAAHGLLMLEPASHNFPDSLYAAAVVGLITAVAQGGALRFGLLGAVTQALRWPGTVVATFVLAAWALFQREDVRTRLGSLVGLVALGGLVAGLAVLTGDAEDLGFILYFETFPEHWHGDYKAGNLLARVPGFYAMWAAYTGGGIVLAVLATLGPRNPHRTSLRAMVSVALVYSLLLCTIDHHPTHYFLPLVALTGPCVVAASAAVGGGLRGNVLAGLQLVGVAWFLSGNRVW